MVIRTRIDRLLVGTPQPFRGDGVKSAIARAPVEGPVLLTATGLAGDQVADTVNHGGRDKALHIYPAEHYTFWRDRYPHIALFDEPGAFGENIACAGMTEDRLCLGDVFRVGRAIIQCTHVRQPCWKQDHRLGTDDAVKTIVATGRSGSYFGVIEEGVIERGDRIFQIDRPHPEWPLKRVFDLLIAGKIAGEGSALQDLAQVSILAPNWRERALKLAEKA